MTPPLSSRASRDEVLVIEDFRKDQYLLKPIVEGLLGVSVRALWFGSAPILIGGVREALSGAFRPIVSRYRSMYRILLVVDRDGDLHLPQLAAEQRLMG
ncbi:MAG: hypothetical protein R3F43_27685 [bacterium]